MNRFTMPPPWEAGALRQYDFTPEVNEAARAAQANPEAMKHFAERGLSPETIKKFKLGYTAGCNDFLWRYPELHTNNPKQQEYRYVIPCLSADGQCHHLTFEIAERSMCDKYSKKYKKPPVSPAVLFNESLLTQRGASGYIFITEGQYDALALEELGCNAVALCGTGYKRLVSLCEQYRPAATIVDALDRDAAGRKTAGIITGAMATIGARFVSVGDIFAGAKDANEALLSDREGFARRVAAFAQRPAASTEPTKDRSQTSESTGDKRFVVFDLETTGLSRTAARIIEIGAVAIEQGKITDRFSTFVNPGVTIPADIALLTGITDNMVKDAPSEDIAVRDFLAFSGDAVIVAHNASFDVGFIGAACERLGVSFDNEVIDTLALSRSLYPELQSHKLEAVVNHLGLPGFNQHRAADDAEALAGAFIRMLADKPQNANLERTRKVSSTPAPKHDTRSKPNIKPARAGGRNMRKTIAIDFDGTLCTNEWPRIGSPRYDVIQRALDERMRGAALVLWTCREGKLLDEAVAACQSWGLTFDAVNDSTPEWKAHFGSNPRKIGATEYWDDKAVRISSSHPAPQQTQQQVSRPQPISTVYGEFW